MKRKVIWATKIVVALSLIGLFSFMALKQNSSLHELMLASQKTENHTMLLEVEISLYQNIISGNYYLQNKKVKLPEDSFFFNENGDKIFSKDLFDNEKLVFRFTENNCSECVNHQFVLLKQYIDNIGQKNLVIVGDYNKNEYLNYISQDAPENVLFLNDNTYFRQLPFEQLNLPYFLLVNENRELSNLMILEKSFDKFFHDYMKMFLGKKHTK